MEKDPPLKKMFELCYYFSVISLHVCDRSHVGARRGRSSCNTSMIGIDCDMQPAPDLDLQSAHSSDAFVAIVNTTQLCRLACSSCTSPLSCTRAPPPADRPAAPCKAPRRQTRNRGATSWCATALVLISASLNIAVAQVTAWCSHCCRYGDHMMTERSTVVRCAYRCMHCEDRTLPCRNECGAMARGHWW